MTTAQLEKGLRVRVTNFLGQTCDRNGKQYPLIGQEGYVQQVHSDGWVSVLLPDHLPYREGYGALLRPSEVEPF
jgi:hypothetical protein